METKMETYDDYIYVKQCLDGNREVFRELVIRYQKYIYYTVYRMVHDPEMSRDLTQEIFIKAFTKLHTYDESYSFKTWIGRIAAHHAIDHVRRRKPEFPVSSDAFRPDQPTAIDLAQSREPAQDQKLLQNERAEIVAGALRHLDPKLRMIVILRHYEDMNYNEIADVLNIPIGTVKNRLFRAREKLQELLLGNPLILQEVLS